MRLRPGFFVCLALGACLGGCSGTDWSFVRPPTLSPVGSGITTSTLLQPGDQPGGDGASTTGGSLWRDAGGDLFRDPRAHHIGDVLTVSIQIDDNAALDSSSDRSRDANSKVGVGLVHDFFSSFTPLPFNITLDSEGDISSKTSTKGKGTTARSEKIKLSVAAIVTGVLPNGNLLISGSQEIRVNHEIRVLNISGIVRPDDISGENRIAYDKIAEARIAYGGRGRIDEVQAPGWGQQILDRINPF